MRAAHAAGTRPRARRPARDGIPPRAGRLFVTRLLTHLCARLHRPDRAGRRPLESLPVHAAEKLGSCMMRPVVGRTAGFPGYGGIQMPHLPRAARFTLTGALAMLLLTTVTTVVHAQAPSDFVPVTDAMLEDPAPGDWLSWRRTANGWGYSLLDQIDRDTVGSSLRLVWSRALATEVPTAGNAAGPRLRDVHGEPAGHRPVHRRGDRRPDLGVPARPAGRPGRLHDPRRVDDWRGGGRRWGLPFPAAFAVPVPHSPPWLRFQSPLIEPDVRISRIRLSDEIMPSPTEDSEYAR